MQLKAKAEAEGGIKAETVALYLPSTEEPLGESTTVSACGMPSELYAVTLQTVVIADVAGVSAERMTDERLEKACADPQAQGDIIILKGCHELCNLSCLVQLESTQVLDISNCFDVDATTVPIAELRWART